MIYFVRLAGATLIALLCFLAAPALAEHPDTQSEIANLKKRIELLEQREAEREHPQPFTLFSDERRLTFAGLIEVEANYEKVEGGDDSSDLVLATAELDIDGQLNDQVAGHMILLWEDGDNGIQVDEAVISLTAPQPVLGHELSLHVGRLYIPFGNFNTNMISDGLTLDLAETRDTTLLVEFGCDHMTSKLGVFNGDTDSDDNDHIDSWFAAVELSPNDTVTFGVSYLNDLAESDIELITDEDLYSHDVPAAGAYVSLALGDFSFDAELISALRHVNAAAVAVGEDLTGNQPCAWTAEIGYQCTEPCLVALRYEQAQDFQDDVRRYGTTVSYGLYDHVLLAMEYLYADAKGDDGDPSHLATAQLALSF